jgi:hypothetical protein
MRDPVGFIEPGTRRSKVHLDTPDRCPLCLERYIDGRGGGPKTKLIEELVDGIKTGKWICAYGGGAKSGPMLRGIHTGRLKRTFEPGEVAKLARAPKPIDGPRRCASALVRNSRFDPR